MVLLQTAVVSRKTPRDGKLEITAETAHRLGDPGVNLRVLLGDVQSGGSVVTLPCHCKGDVGHTIHVFLQSDVLQTLTPESSVALEVDPALPGKVRVTPAPSKE